MDQSPENEQRESLDEDRDDDQRNQNADEDEGCGAHLGSRIRHVGNLPCAGSGDDAIVARVGRANPTPKGTAEKVREQV